MRWPCRDSPHQVDSLASGNTECLHGLFKRWFLTHCQDWITYKLLIKWICILCAPYLFSGHVSGWYLCVVKVTIVIAILHGKTETHKKGQWAQVLSGTDQISRLLTRTNISTLQIPRNTVQTQILRHLRISASRYLLCPRMVPLRAVVLNLWATTHVGAEWPFYGGHQTPS